MNISKKVKKELKCKASIGLAMCLMFQPVIPVLASNQTSSNANWNHQEVATSSEATFLENDVEKKRGN